MATYSDNEKTIKFYQGFGFELEGVFMYDEYFGKRPRHVVSMALFLGNNTEDSKIEREKLIKKLSLL